MVTRARRGGGVDEVRRARHRVVGHHDEARCLQCPGHDGLSGSFGPSILLEEVLQRATRERRSQLSIAQVSAGME